MGRHFQSSVKGQDIFLVPRQRKFSLVRLNNKDIHVDILVTGSSEWHSLTSASLRAPVPISAPSIHVLLPYSDFLFRLLFLGSKRIMIIPAHPGIQRRRGKNLGPRTPRRNSEIHLD